MRARRHAACIYVAHKMWYVKDLIDRAQVAFLLWRLRRRRRLGDT